MTELTNHMIGCAYSNRYLSQLTGQDHRLTDIAAVLAKLSASLHQIGSELVSHILTHDEHGIHYSHYDVGQPSWTGEPVSLVIGSNRDLVLHIKKFLSVLKAHKHDEERILMKNLLEETKVVELWDNLDDLLVGASISAENVLTGGNSSIKERAQPDEDESCLKEPDDKNQILKSQQTDISTSYPATASNKEDKAFAQDGERIESLIEDKEISSDEDELPLQNTSKDKTPFSTAGNTGTDAQVTVAEPGKNVQIKEMYDKKKCVYLVSEGYRWCSCKSDMTTFILRLVKRLQNKKVKVLLPDEYLSNKDLTEHEESTRLSSWDGQVEELYTGVDLVVCIGGDGSLLEVGRTFQTVSPPVLAFGAGKKNILFSEEVKMLGKGKSRTLLKFMTKKILSTLERGKDVQADELCRQRLELTIHRDFEPPLKLTVLNEIAIVRGSACPARLQVQLEDEETQATLPLLEGDGLIVATATGSSGYSLAAGGPLVHPSLSCIVLTPLASRSCFPLVLPATSNIFVTQHPTSTKSGLIIEVDGKKVAEVKEKGILMIKASDFNLRQIMNVDVSAYFEIVLGKLVASSDVVNSKK